MTRQTKNKPAAADYREVKVEIINKEDHAEIKFGSTLIVRSKAKEDLADVFDKFCEYMQSEEDAAAFKPGSFLEVKSFLTAIAYERGIKTF